MYIFWSEKQCTWLLSIGKDYRRGEGSKNNHADQQRRNGSDVLVSGVVWQFVPKQLLVI